MLHQQVICVDWTPEPIEEVDVKLQVVCPLNVFEIQLRARIKYRVTQNEALSHLLLRQLDKRLQELLSAYDTKLLLNTPHYAQPNL